MKINLEKGAKKTEAGNNYVLAESGGFPMGRDCNRRKEVSEGNAAVRENIDVNRSYAYCMHNICS